MILSFVFLIIRYHNIVQDEILSCRTSGLFTLIRAIIHVFFTSRLVARLCCVESTSFEPYLSYLL